MENIVDYKKEYKELYLPKTEPALIKIPEIQYASVIGKGNPNAPNGEYKNAIEILYGIQYTIKMSKKGTYTPDGYFDYVVPPLEGFWWSDTETEMKNKSNYNWISVIRLPEYVTKDVFIWACTEASKKKKIDTAKAQLLKIAEGLCVQCMHIGSFNDEPKTLKSIDDFIEKNNLIKDINDKRRHHEIYLSDPRKTAETKMKTALRIPAKSK
ncbi:MAG: GyrI-like domain-containing protein [Treponemataceae bacterium]|nr:MAG: GyrI-like domain-containing protein [Treponemataceae bacterium]